MSTAHKKSGIPARSIKKVAKGAIKKTESTLAPAVKRLHASARLKHARAISKQAPGRAIRFLKNTAVRVVVGASAMAFVLVKLKQHLT